MEEHFENLRIDPASGQVCTSSATCNESCPVHCPRDDNSTRRRRRLPSPPYQEPPVSRNLHRRLLPIIDNAERERKIALLKARWAQGSSPYQVPPVSAYRHNRQLSQTGSAKKTAQSQTSWSGRSSPDHAPPASAYHKRQRSQTDDAEKYYKTAQSQTSWSGRSSPDQVPPYPPYLQLRELPESDEEKYFRKAQSQTSSRNQVPLYRPYLHLHELSQSDNWERELQRAQSPTSWSGWSFPDDAPPVSACLQNRQLPQTNSEETERRILQWEANVTQATRRNNWLRQRSNSDSPARQLHLAVDLTSTDSSSEPSLYRGQACAPRPQKTKKPSSEGDKNEHRTP